MAHPCEPAGCSGFGLGSRRRSGYEQQGLSDHAGGSGPWTSGGRATKESKEHCEPQKERM